MKKTKWYHVSNARAFLTHAKKVMQLETIEEGEEKRERGPYYFSGFSFSLLLLFFATAEAKPTVSPR
jgi:hypothetical protein